MPVVSPRLALLNLVLIGVAGYFGLELMRELSSPRPLPNRPAPRAAGSPAADAPGDPSARPDARGGYGVIASRNLFSPSRTDVVATGPEGGGAPAVPRPILHGVVLDETKSRAYLEEATTKRVFGYAVGDTVGGGKLEAIRADRVVLARPEGRVEVMLRDPSKPPPPAAAATAQPGLQPGFQPGGLQPGLQPGIQPPITGTPFPSIRPGIGASAAPGVPATAVPAPMPSVGVQPITPPRPLQSIPSDFLRRPTVAPPEAGGR